MAQRKNRKSTSSMSGSLADSVVLLSNMNRSTCGTGFVVGGVGDTAHVFTCDHVIDQLGGPEQVWAANRKARVEFSGKKHGIDLAVLAVTGLAASPCLQLGSGVEPKVGTPFSLWGYSRLNSNSDKYLGQLVTGRLGACMAMQAQTAERGVAAWELLVDPNSPPVVGGYSGAPVFIEGQGVVAVFSHTFDEKRGLSISTRTLLPPGAKRASWELPAVPPPIEPEVLAEWPELPAEGPNPDDPEKGRWGGVSERDGVKLSAIVTDVRRKLFYFDLVLSSTDGNSLDGPALFHLHPTYPRRVILIRKVRSNKTLVLEQVSAHGTYTIGAEVKRQGSTVVRLELDLDNLPEIPKRFH